MLKKALASFLVVAALAACERAVPAFYPKQYQKIAALCQDYGGLKAVTFLSLSREKSQYRAHCKEGPTFIVPDEIVDLKE